MEEPTSSAVPVDPAEESPAVSPASTESGDPSALHRLALPHAGLRYPAPLAVGETIRLNRVMVRALRFRELNPSEAFTLQDATGRFFRARFLGSTPQRGEALIYEQMLRSPESPALVTLVCAVLARQRMMEVIRKATELGAVRLIPVFTEHSVGPEGLEHEKAHAWPRTALRATRQCRRASVVQVLPAAPLADVLAGELWRTAELRLALDDRAPDCGWTPEAPRAAGRPPLRTICLASGPEGGWSDAERALLAESGAVSMALGGRVLRAETAPIVGLTLLQHWLGDLCPRPPAAGRAD